MKIRLKIGINRLYPFFLIFLLFAGIICFYIFNSSSNGKLVPLCKNVHAVQRYSCYTFGGIRKGTLKDQQSGEMLKKRQEAQNAENTKAEAKKQKDIKKAQDTLPASKTAVSKTAPSKAAASTTPPAKSAPAPALIDVLPLNGSSQAILILGGSTSSEYAKCEVYEKTGNQWSKKWTCNSVVGRNGMSANRHEGDKTSPMGIFGFIFEFGSAQNPGTKMEYRHTSSGDLWTSNPYNINEYNTWIHYTGADPNGRFYDFEDLYATSVYKYAAAIDFNYGSGKVIGKGSAIFMHISPNSGRGTLGCVGLPEGTLVQILKWMDPTKRPKIIIGTEKYLRGLK